MYFGSAVVRFILEYFKSVKEDLLGPVNEETDDEFHDIEASLTEGTHLMRQDTVDITEQEISNSNGVLRNPQHGNNAGELQMHRPTVQVLEFPIKWLHCFECICFFSEL